MRGISATTAPLLWAAILEPDARLFGRRVKSVLRLRDIRNPGGAPYIAKRLRRLLIRARLDQPLFIVLET
jgi:hypothetical protein